MTDWLKELGPVIGVYGLFAIVGVLRWLHDAAGFTFLDRIEEFIEK